MAGALLTGLLLLVTAEAKAGAQPGRPTAIDDSVSLMFSWSFAAAKPKPKAKPAWAGCKDCCMDGDKVVPCLDVQACAARGPKTGKYAFVYSYWSPLHNTRFLENIESLQEQAGIYGMDILMLMLQKDIDETPRHVLKAMDRQGVKLVPVGWDVPPGMLFKAPGGKAASSTGVPGGWCGPMDLIRLHLFGLTDYDAVAYFDSDVELQGDVLPMLRCAASGRLLTTGGAASPVNAGVVALRPDRRILNASIAFAQRANFDAKTGWGDSGYAPFAEKFLGAECGQGFMHTLFYKAGSNKLARQCLEESGLKPEDVGAAQMDQCVWNYEGSEGCGAPEDFDCSAVRVHHVHAKHEKHSCKKKF